MVQSLGVEEFIDLARTQPVLDVRTPAEFAKAHIPGALNLPLFSNEERVQIGTLYKQVGRQEAILEGLDIVGSRMRRLVEEAARLVSGKHVLLHCWRGGMRSGSVAWLLDFCGYKVCTLAGGYKAFRRFVLDTFAMPRPLLVLGGKTGSGKTHILGALQKLGAQTVDLEAMAHHKGSSFGRLGQIVHPTQEQFENDLAWSLHHTTPKLPVWVEDESRRLGWVRIPDAFWNAMCNAPLVVLEVPAEQRIEMLIHDYGTFTHQELANAVERIASQLGGLDTRLALQALSQGDLSTACQIVLRYYDKTYLYSLSRRELPPVKKIETPLQTPESIANLLFDFSQTFQQAYNELQ